MESLGRLGPVAQAAGVVLCIENHFGTLAVSAEQSAALVRDVAHPNVGILYDQANLTFTHCEDYADAIAVQASAICHVHAKDLVFVDPDAKFQAAQVHRLDPDKRHVRSRVVGKGVLPWVDVFSTLLRAGYDDTVSIEYEARWAPELPPPAIGILQSAAALRAAHRTAVQNLSTDLDQDTEGAAQSELPDLLPPFEGRKFSISRRPRRADSPPTR